MVQYLVNKLAWYYALNGINILLLIGRVLKRMDFQPRLGVVTRSLALAGPDLIHFCLVCGMVFVGYAMMAHLIFGNTIQVSRMHGCHLRLSVSVNAASWCIITWCCLLLADGNMLVRSFICRECLTNVLLRVFLCLHMLSVLLCACCIYKADIIEQSSYQQAFAVT